MAFASSQTNPITISATGYAPYMDQRAEAASKKKGHLNQAEKHALTVRNFWVRENRTQGLASYSKGHACDLLRSQWEGEADRKSLRSRVRWEMDKVQAQMDDDLDRRRRRLGELLKSEQDRLLQETCPEPEDEETRTQRMMTRYQELKTKKEEERLKVVDEKKDQQFRRNCEELRTQLSRKLERRTAEEAKRIQEERLEAARLERGTEEALAAAMWERDEAAKAYREGAEAADRRRRDRECAEEVLGQAAHNKVRRIRAMKDKDEDAQIMAEKMRLDALEDEWSRQLKKKKQESLKEDLDKCLRAKLKKRAQEVQDELAQDLFFLKQLMSGDDEPAKQDEKKRALMREQQLYLQYLHERLAQEAEFEKRVDRMFQEELERVWQKRKEEWEREKQKRREKEQDVTRALQEQLATNIKKSQAALVMSREYGDKIRKEDEADRKAALEKLKLIRERNAQHQREILDQIKFKQEKLEDEHRIREQELESVRKAREYEETKIKQMLSDLQIDNEHPYRVVRREFFNECDDSR